MSAYVDASVLVSLFVEDVFSDRATSVLRNSFLPVIVSDFAAAEFSSAIARRVRMKEIGADQALALFSNFDGWIVRETARAQTTNMDVVSAGAFLRRLDLTLRTADALHIAIAQRMGAKLITFDRRMAADARALGVEVLEG